jgi:hypothetical protein
MWFCKKKDAPLTLPASQARVIAQMQQEEKKFKEQQSILHRILGLAKHGYYSVSWHSQYGANYQDLLTDEQIKWLKSLGYTVNIKTKQEVYNGPVGAVEYTLTIQTVSWE